MPLYMNLLNVLNFIVAGTDKDKLQSPIHINYYIMIVLNNHRQMIDIHPNSFCEAAGRKDEEYVEQQQRFHCEKSEIFIYCRSPKVNHFQLKCTLYDWRL